MSASPLPARNHGVPFMKPLVVETSKTQRVSFKTSFLENTKQKQHEDSFTLIKNKALAVRGGGEHPDSIWAAFWNDPVALCYFGFNVGLAIAHAERHPRGLSFLLGRVAGCIFKHWVIFARGYTLEKQNEIRVKSEEYPLLPLFGFLRDWGIVVLGFKLFLVTSRRHAFWPSGRRTIVALTSTFIIYMRGCKARKMSHVEYQTDGFDTFQFVTLMSLLLWGRLTKN